VGALRDRIRTRPRDDHRCDCGKVGSFDLNRAELPAYHKSAANSDAAHDKNAAVSTPPKTAGRRSG